MIPLEKTPHTQTDQLIKQAIGVAEYYGFLPIKLILPNYNENKRTKTRSITQYTEYSSSFDNELVSVMKSYIEHGHAQLTEPILIYNNYLNNQKDSDTILFGLHVIGALSSIAEALLVKTAIAVLDDLGIKEKRIHVNSLGDRDSANRFAKELTDYLRRNLNDLPGYSRQTMKKDIFCAYDQLLKEKHQVCAGAPSTVDFLTEASRQHLKEILEYFEVAEVEYKLDPTLIGHQDCYSKILFEIRAHTPSEKEGEELVVYARGGRYDEIAQQAFKQQVPAVGIVFECEKKGRIPKNISISTKKQKPKIYFIQLGFEARLRSLPIIESLRQAKIPVYQSLGKEQLSSQLELAEELQIPYSIIMGHKEALDGTVIVRKMDTRSQNIIPVGRLPEYLKTL